MQDLQKLVLDFNMLELGFKYGHEMNVKSSSIIWFFKLTCSLCPIHTPTCFIFIHVTQKKQIPNTAIYLINLNNRNFP